MLYELFKLYELCQLYVLYKLYELRKLYEYFVNHLKSFEIALNYLNCFKYNIFVSQNFE